MQGEFDSVIEESYINAYMLLMEFITFDDLGDGFYLPVDYEDIDNVIKYFESIEDYEKCEDLKELNK